MLAQQRYKSTGDILCEEGDEGRFVRKNNNNKKRGEHDWRLSSIDKGAAHFSVDEDEDELEFESRRKPLLFNEQQESSVSSLWGFSSDKFLVGSQYKQKEYTYLWQADDDINLGQKEIADSTSCWANRKLKSPSSYNVESDHYYVKTKAIKQQKPVTPASISKEHLKKDRIGKWRANGARRRKVATSSTLRLALSSPILASSALSAETLEQQQFTFCSTGLLTSSISGNKQEQHTESLTTDNTQVSDEQKLKLANGDASSAHNLEDEDEYEEKEEACEIATSKATSPVKKAEQLKRTTVQVASVEAERGYYFAHLRSADEQLKPVQCKLTIGESSCCYEGKSKSNNKTSCCILDDKTQDSVDDNGIDFSSSPSKLIQAQGRGVGGSKEKQLQLQEQPLAVPNPRAQTVVTTSSGNTSGNSTILPILNLQQHTKQQQQQQQSTNFQYAPAQQVSHANHDQHLKLNNQPQQQQQQQQGLKSEQNIVNNKNKSQELLVETLVFPQGDGQRTNKTPSSTTTTSLPPKTNTVAGKLMGSYCNSWRQALHPNNSGTYKVARQHQHQQQGFVAISGLCQPLEIAETNGQQQQVVFSGTRNVINGSSGSGNGNGSGISGCRRAISTRLPRPIRSPISLQRQTNARLVKHRLKIQQQRQEQLAQLAIRERQQLNQKFTSKQNQSSNNRIQNMPLDDCMQRIPNQALYIINNTPSFNRSTSSNSSSKSTFRDTQDCNTRLLNNIPHSNGLNEQNKNQQHQVILPTVVANTTRAIEICDNQLACSSRQNNNQPAHSYISIMSCYQTSNSSSNQHHQQQQEQQQKPTNLVNKTINMLQNATTSHVTENHQQHCLGKKKITRFDKNYKEVKEEDEDDGDDTKTISSNESTLSLNRPFCKICHIGSTKNGDKLISPCKCSGTMQYIHCGCLLKWLEISNRTNEKPMSCELCAHEYSWHKKFNYKHIKWPRCSMKDITLHIIFVIALGIMIFSALAPIVQRRVVDTTRHQSTTTSYGLSSSSSSAPTSSSSSLRVDIQPARALQATQIYHATFNGRSNHLTTTGHLAHEEKFMLICAALFFLSFFLAIYVQTKARDTLYGLVGKFLNLNQTYYITEYDHGQLNINNNLNTTNSKQQQQQPAAQDNHRTHRKSTSDELTNH